MTVDEPTRHELFNWFAEQMPEHLAEAMMKSIPPTGWGEIAARNDLNANAVLLRGEMAEVRGEMAQLRGEMAELGAEVRSEIAELRTEVRRGFTMAGSDLTTAVARTNRTVALTAVATTVSTWGVVVAAIGLG